MLFRPERIGEGTRMNLLCQTVPLQYDTVYSPYAAAEWKAAFADLHAQVFTGVEIAVA